MNYPKSTPRLQKNRKATLYILLLLLSLGIFGLVRSSTYREFLGLSSTNLASVSQASSAVKKSLFNFFSIEPIKYLKITAPSFSFLPLYFSSTTINPVKTPSKSENLLKDDGSTEILSKSLEQSSAPLISQRDERPELAIVNIFCSQKIVLNGKVTSQRRTITGSGVLINNEGLILTNAHVGQFPLLSDSNPNVSCLARYGNPASNSLSIKTLYISPDWVQQYGKNINTEGAPQTGRSDFALLKVLLPSGTKALKPITVQKSLPSESSPIQSLSYPANILGIKGVNASLPMEKENLSVLRYYSIGTVSNDVLETSPSFAGQKGSSGGAIIDSHGHLIGIITTVINSSDPAKKHIRAMTIEHIDAEFSRFSNKSLSHVIQYGSTEIEKTFNLQYREYLTSLLNNYLN